MEVWVIALGWMLFGGTHIGLAADPIRSNLVSRLGAGPFRGIYSLVALASLGFLVFAYASTRPAGGIVLDWGMYSPVTLRIAEILGVLAFVLLFTGFFNRTPLGMLPGNPAPHGITRITRHPMNMAFALFAIAHLLTNRFAGDWVFFGGFILYGFLGSLHQDRKAARKAKGSLDEFISATSIVPFAAIVAGRQKLKLGEISRLGALVGVLVALAARWAHY